MSATGAWNLRIKTPMGEQKMQAQFIADGDSLSGTMQDANQPATAIKDGLIKADQLTWKFDLKKPFPMTLSFSVVLDGEAFKGTAKAGVFPPAPVSGTRA